jgi:hypothetical protein
MKAETKKAFERLETAVERLESARAGVRPAPDPDMKAEIKAIRKIVDEAISLLDKQTPKTGTGAK